MNHQKSGGCIYFIQAENGGLVKIGYTENLDKRFRIIQAHSPERMRIIGKIKGSMATEEEIHSKFARDRRHGEWFELSKRLMQLIELHGYEGPEQFPEIDLSSLHTLKKVGCVSRTIKGWRGKKWCVRRTLRFDGE